MIINSAPQHEAVLSNVGEIGEFRIRNSAKAFNILSSGLYANKIRAIIRELSCNAVDSHVAAGNTQTPFDVHLPTQLEPWFAIRDYGTGLDHDQVTNIYTTYFESTKTDSNAFIGALGLGSKSPFSYTDNFTVTAVKDGRKGIYTAFINEQGVPSIALMLEEQTTDPAGVEVKFSVNDRYDFSKFVDEARYIYTYFSLRPVVGGVANFEFRDVDYDTKNIVPGVHSYRDSYRNRSTAIMGNIAYPIDLPQGSDVGGLNNLLGCGLEMQFAIGELDFQASREGLSYIPQTVEAIKKKLIAVNEALSIVLAKEADAIPNLWDRAIFLYGKYNSNLWSAAVKKYVAETKLPTYDDGRYGGTKTFKMGIDNIAKKYNIAIRGFKYSRSHKVLPNIKNDTEYGERDAQGRTSVTHYWGINVSNDVKFVINDGKVGAVERAKHHWRTTKPDSSMYVYVLEKADKTKDMNVKAFFKAICSPPKSNIQLASELTKKERNGSRLGKNVTILSLEKRGSGGYYREREMVWRPTGKLEDFDDSTTYYYVPLSGFEMQSTKGYTSGKEMYDDVQSVEGLFNGTIYGVRKGDIEAIKLQKNWVNFEEHIVKQVSAKKDQILASLVKAKLDGLDIIKYNTDSVMKLIDATSPYAKLAQDFGKTAEFKGSITCVERLFKRFIPDMNTNVDQLVSQHQAEINSVNRRYPLLNKLSTYRVEASDIAEYVNLIDTVKGLV